VSAAGRVLVTPRSLTAAPHPALGAITSAGYSLVFSRAGVLPEEPELLKLLPGCVGWLAGVEPVSEAVVHSAPELRVISRNGIGTDNLPVALLRERGIRIETAAGANASGVAELTLGLMLAALRNIAATDAGIKAGGWPRLRGRELRGRNVGVLGFGEIGRRVGGLSVAFGASVLAYDPMLLDTASPVGVRWASVAAIIAESDLITLHCPPPAGGEPLIGRTELAAMRDGVILVNAARGSLVDEAAICEALASKKLASYAADVFAREPPGSLELAGHPRVIATSHIGAFTDESVERATVDAVRNLLGALATTNAGAGR
jgi:D-3-phosphoglycerate dehydrogenase